MKQAYDFAVWDEDTLSKFAAELWAAFLIQEERIKELEQIIERYKNETNS
jgi:hypothetical protein